MKKILFATMAGAAAVITIAPANAADLGLRPMDAAPPAFTWSGCYIGGNIGGGGWGRETVSIPNLGQTTGVPELAGVSLPSVTGNTKALSVAVRSGATINLHPTG
jgi:outer membrane immunogenic protein